LAEETVEICRQKGFTYWLGVVSTFRGLALAWQGEYIWRTNGAIIGLPEYLIILAEVLGNAG